MSEGWEQGAEREPLGSTGGLRGRIHRLRQRELGYQNKEPQQRILKRCGIRLA
jgi:hypothetical protein